MCVNTITQPHNWSGSWKYSAHSRVGGEKISRIRGGDMKGFTITEHFNPTPVRNCWQLPYSKQIPSYIVIIELPYTLLTLVCIWCLFVFQMPIFISVFVGLRQMANLPVETMATGGLFWFTDLTIPDPTWVLPFLTVGTLLATIEVTHLITGEHLLRQTMAF